MRDVRQGNHAVSEERDEVVCAALGVEARWVHARVTRGWQLLDGEHNVGMQLTESVAMGPAAAVSGWYFAHPQSQYFILGRLARDQVEDYAGRKGWDRRTAEKWLAPNLGYEPED